MIRIKSEFEDPRRVGEHYLDEVSGPISISRHTRSDELWTYYRGTVQERPCEIRIAAIRDDLLSGVREREGYGFTCVTLVRETRRSVRRVM